MLLFESIFIFMVLCIIEVIWGKEKRREMSSGNIFVLRLNIRKDERFLA